MKTAIGLLDRRDKDMEDIVMLIAEVLIRIPVFVYQGTYFYLN